MSKNDDFWENLPNCWKKVSNVKINEGKGPFIGKMPNFKWILSKKTWKKGNFLRALRQ